MMRNSTGGTSSAKRNKNIASSNEEKNSAKKLVQARLPFKVIAPGSSPPVAADSAITTEIGAKQEGKDGKQSDHKDTKEARKRKLSYDSEDDVKADEGPDNVSKENVEVAAKANKKKKVTAPSSEIDIVSLLDDDEDDDDATKDTSKAVTSKGTALKTPKAKAVVKGNRKGAGTPQTSSSAQKEKSGSVSKLQIKIPLSAGKRSKRRKSKANSSLANTSSNDISQKNISCADSSDDIEDVSSELNPQKRTKLDPEEKQKDTEDTTKKCAEAISLDSDSDSDEDKNKEIRKESRENIPEKVETNKYETGITENYQETAKINPQKRTKLDPEEKQKDTEDTTKKCAEAISLDSDSDSDEDKNKEIRKESRENIPEKVETNKYETGITENYQETAKINPEKHDQVEDKEDDPDESVLIGSDDGGDEDEDADDDADDETENTSIKNANVSSDISEDSKSKHNVTAESIKDSENAGLKNKNLTPKQKKLLEQRHNAREEKERKLQDEKKKKQEEKEEKELAKKREREEKEDQKRKEREEKEDQRRKEREEKERKRLAEVEAKNEEKRKRAEAKEEEIRKKDEERKRKEQEKEEADLKKKKAAEAFTKFFVAKAPSNDQQNIDDDECTGDGTKSLAFRPFQIKGDMKLAPICRKAFTNDAKHRLDSLLGIIHRSKDGKNDQVVIGDDSDDEDIVRTKQLSKSKLYLSELRSGKVLPGKWRRPSTESKDDVVIIEDDLEPVGEAIAEDTPAYIREEMRVKFYKFHDNRRPPYYGTWRKKSSVINAKKPFALDKEFFDYEVDSDDEWEEEEPGESLEDGSDDDKEKESEDDDYEVDNEWFVPHGHLSDEEMQNEDELGNGDDNTREAQKAKLQILQQEFVQEMKKKTEKIKPRLIGCIWIDANGKQPAVCQKIIWDTLNTRSMLCKDPPILDEPEVEEPSSPSASIAEKPVVLKPITITDAMFKDLARLVHGNNQSKNFLIKEYMAYVGKTEETVKNGEFAYPLKSVIREKIDSIAEWQVVEATASSINQANTDVNESTKKKRKIKKRLCWVVKQESLDKMDMSSLSLQNSWEYILAPKVKLDKESTKPDEGTLTIAELPATDSSSKPDDKIENKAKSTTSQITKFTKVLTAEEKANKLEKSTSTSTSKNYPKNIKINTENKVKSPAANPQTSKEKKRVPLLMSVGRGQQISTPAKNKLISQFLRKGSNDVKNSGTPSSKINGSSSTVADDDDVVILD